MKIGDTVYYCMVVPNCNVYDVLKLTIRTVEDSWAVGVDEHTKQSYLFGYDMIGKYIFTQHYEAQEAILNFRAKTEVVDNVLQAGE
jgi:hypothetical protein